MTTATIPRPVQSPEPGSHLLFHRGDLVEIVLTLAGSHPGDAWLRTNLGKEKIRRFEIIRGVEDDLPILAMDWHDIPMRRIDERHYSIRLPLLDVGRFEAKAFFLPAHSDTPVWPQGNNTIIKVEPAEYGIACTIYTAFVRQFGHNKHRRVTVRDDARALKDLDESGYEVIPPSGKFRDLIKELDFIVGKLRCRIIQLLPIHPVPTTHARMGRFGSPFAALDLMDVDPALAEFDRRTTPLDQFLELVDAIHSRSARVFLDIPLNHTGWASRLQVHHPEWFIRNPDRSFYSPQVWGVTWEDLTQLDFSKRDLWQYVADVFLFWCRHGVDGFRCDAGYMIPVPVWQYIVAHVREEFPDTIFLLEGLGGRPETMEELLDVANLNWAYSELFQNYDRNQISAYLPSCIRVSLSKGVLVHYAETHDNDRLAARSPAFARMRTAISALFSHNGAFGITNGVEWFATEKVDVHGAPSLNWGSKENQTDHIATLNTILETHPAFYPGTRLRLIQRGDQNTIVLVRENPAQKASLLVLANLNDSRPTHATWAVEDFPAGGGSLTDLITGKAVQVDTHRGHATYALAPAEVLCLTPNASEAPALASALSTRMALPEHSRLQVQQAKALDIYTHYHGLEDLHDVDVGQLVERLLRNPKTYCAEMAGSPLAPVTIWEWPRDLKRTVMVPPGHFLCARAPDRFVVELDDGEQRLRHETSVRAHDGSHFALLMPLDSTGQSRRLTLAFAVPEGGTSRRASAPVLFLSSWDQARVQTSFDRNQVHERDSYALLANGRGAMAQIRGAWGDIRSQYDALLAGNLNDQVPVDRHIMFTRCRAWVVCRGYSQEVNTSCLERFFVRGDVAVWQFRMPAGMGKIILLSIQIRMREGQNHVSLTFIRDHAGTATEVLADDTPITVILRPDIEDRMNHGTTKAFTGPETAWPGAIHSTAHGFEFTPAHDRILRIHAHPGTFTPEPEWRYMVSHPFEATRGLDDRSDLFSPGYFMLTLAGGQTAIVEAEISTGVAHDPAPAHDLKPVSPVHKTVSLEDAMHTAMRQFIVKRDDGKTIIAGYPWFLDWGRDTLICLRGLIAAGFLNEARSILRQFAHFEAHGTLPNMIRGTDSSNRDTSDAPLWFFVACADLLRTETQHDFLDHTCGGRTIRQVLSSIAVSYIDGTPNGVRMDPASGLIFSPSHFTWMDTNHPAGTPREGYPIEIQALWYAALHFMGEIEPSGRWYELAGRVRASIQTLYTRTENGGLVDCLHARPGQPAVEAMADDALRPNQLLAITLGAVTDANLCASIVSACEELLVPGAIRSLADRPVTCPLPIVHSGKGLNDPHHPYWGQYEGDEDTRRKPSYHNGTAWTWLFPSYAEALVKTYGAGARDAALSLLASSTELINEACVGQVPEILDGDTPHRQRGCGAQAWGATELYRVLAILSRMS